MSEINENCISPHSVAQLLTKDLPIGPLMKAILQSLLFVLVFSVCSSATAQAQAETQIQAQDSKQHPSVEINSIVLQQLFDLQDRVNRLEYSRSATDSIEQNKEIELLKQQLSQLTQSVNLQHGKLSNQVDQYEGRISDIGAGVDRFGVWTTVFLGVITIAALFLGFQARSTAIKEARKTIKEESKRIEAEFREEIESLLEDAKHQLDEKIKTLLKAAENEWNDFISQSGKDFDDLKSVMEKAISETGSLTNEQIKKLEDSSKELLQKVGEKLTPRELYQLGVTELTRENYSKAIEYFEQSERHPDALDFGIALSLLVKAHCLNLDHRPDEELATYDDLIRRFGNSEQSDIQEQVAKAIFNKGVRLGKQNFLEDALHTFENLITRLEGSEQPVLQAIAFAARNNKGLSLFKLSRLEEALHTFEYTINRYAESSQPELQAHATFAITSIAELSLLLESPESSEQRIYKALDHLDSSSLETPVMKLLLFLLDKADINQVLQGIEKLPEDTEFTWEFNEIRDYLNQFSGVKGEQVQAFVRFFEAHHDLEKLKEELDEIKGDK